MRRNTLYVTDMDGTLLDNSSHVSPESAAIITDLTGRGALITVATARTPATVVPLLAATAIECPAIVMTGAAMWDGKRREMTHTRLIPRSTTAELMDAFKVHGIDPFVYMVANPTHLDVYHGVEMTRIERSFYEERRNLKLKKFHIGCPVPEEDLDSAILFFAIGASEPVIALAGELESRGDCAVSFYPDIHTRDNHLIEVFASGVSKAQAIKTLAAELNVNRIVVFGDNLNDLPMMEIADVAVAVENAFPEVKEKADVVIESNAAHSVARYIRED